MMGAEKFWRKDAKRHFVKISCTHITKTRREGLRSRIKKVRGIALVVVNASEGLWYDALQSISTMIEQSLATVRATLLEQAGLQGTGQ